MDPIIRTYVPKDKEVLMEAFKTNVPLYFTVGEVGDFERFLNRFEDPEEQNNPPFFTVELNGTPIGCGGFTYRADADAVVFVWGLVHNTEHKKGYGELLLQHRLKAIKLAYPEKQIILDTTQHSFSFFEKYGFKTVKITEDFYAEGMHRYDMILQD